MLRTKSTCKTGDIHFIRLTSWRENLVDILHTTEVETKAAKACFHLPWNTSPYGHRWVVVDCKCHLWPHWQSWCLCIHQTYSSNFPKRHALSVSKARLCPQVEVRDINVFVFTAFTLPNILLTVNRGCHSASEFPLTVIAQDINQSEPCCWSWGRRKQLNDCDRKWLRSHEAKSFIVMQVSVYTLRVFAFGEIPCTESITDVDTFTSS